MGSAVSEAGAPSAVSAPRRAAPSVSAPRLAAPSAVSGLGAIGSAAKGVGSVAGPALSGAAKVAGEGAGVVGQGLSQATKAVGGATSAVNGAVGGATSAVSGAVGGATSAVNSTLTSTVQSLESALPPEFQDVVARAQTDSDTAVALIGLTAAVPIGLVVLGAATRGYAGDKNPFVVEEQLKKDRRAFLIDTRSEDARRNDGVPDLRGKARGKGAAVEVATLPADERRVLSNPRLVELELAATKVKALTKGGARVYILGPDAKDLAKAITRLGGRRAFVVSGGFDAWRSSGLKVGVKYAKSALEGLGEDTSEAASSFTQKVAGSVKTSITTKKPTDAIVPLLGLVSAAAAAYNYKTALEYAGVIGIELTILAKLLSYESPWAFFEDVKETAAGVVGAVGSFEPPSVPEVSVPKVNVPSVAEMAPPPRPAPAPAKEEAKVEEVVEEEEVAERGRGAGSRRARGRGAGSRRGGGRSAGSRRGEEGREGLRRNVRRIEVGDGQGCRGGCPARGQKAGAEGYVTRLCASSEPQLSARRDAMRISLVCFSNMI